jgi:hypothetical protein
MASANEGDPKAQNYVGEIYERGMGVAPDYAQAAVWYEQAAGQGYAPAQINLGQLYEQGLGVPKDPVQALNLYREASGFQQAGLTYVATTDVAEEMDTLRQQVVVEKSGADQLRREIEDLEQQITALEEAQATANGRTISPVNDQAQQALEADRAALAREREEARQTLAELQAMEASLAERERTLDAEAAALEARRAAATSDAERGEVDRLLAELSERQLVFEADSNELRARSEVLSGREAEMARREAELEAQADALLAREAELNRREAEMNVLSTEKVKLDTQLEQLREEFENRRQQLESLTDQQEVTLRGPEIQMIDPEVSMARGTEQVEVPVVRTRTGVGERVVIGKVNAPAGLLTLFVNDQEQQIDDRSLFRATVPIQGEGTSVAIVAVDRQGKRGDLKFVLTPVTEAAAYTEASGALTPQRELDSWLPPIDFGAFYALVIGNNEYRYLPKLDSASNDASAVAEILAKRYGFEVTVLKNADRYQILSALNAYRERLTENDNLLIYYAGHGELDRANMRGHWLPVDAEPNSTANWISNVQITDILNTMAAKRILVVADSCYSGTLTRASLAQLDTGMSVGQRRAWLEALAKKRSRTALTSGGLAPTLDGGGEGHSVFADALLDVLESNQSLLEGQRLYQEVSARVTYEAGRYRFEQVPQYAPIKYAGHEAGEFFLLPQT